MNIFVLDNDPRRAAEYHCDKHVVKMILESAQMLCTVLGGPYAATHKNHPCTKWVAERQANAEWLIQLACNLNLEWRARYGHDRNHMSWDAIIESVRSGSIYNLPKGKRTPFVLAMPEEYKDDDAVTAYRAYYRSKSFAKWAHSEAPSWW